MGYLRALKEKQEWHDCRVIRTATAEVIVYPNGIVAKRLNRDFSNYGVEAPKLTLWKNERHALTRCVGYTGLQQMVGLDGHDLVIYSRDARTMPGASLNEILHQLAMARINHQDIRADNLIKGTRGWVLIDFAWAKHPLCKIKDFPGPLEPDDERAMEKARREIGR